jgi:hypothetical protein
VHARRILVYVCAAEMLSPNYSLNSSANVCIRAAAAEAERFSTARCLCLINFIISIKMLSQGGRGVMIITELFKSRKLLRVGAQQLAHNIILYTYARCGAHYAGAGALSASEDKNTRAATRKKQTQHDWSTQYI